jgi:hypothetical protein
MSGGDHQPYKRGEDAGHRHDRANNEAGHPFDEVCFKLSDVGLGRQLIQVVPAQYAAGPSFSSAELGAHP